MARGCYPERVYRGPAIFWGLVVVLLLASLGFGLGAERQRRIARSRSSLVRFDERRGYDALSPDRTRSRAGCAVIIPTKVTVGCAMNRVDADPGEIA